MYDVSSPAPSSSSWTSSSLASSPCLFWPGGTGWQWPCKPGGKHIAGGGSTGGGGSSAGGGGGSAGGGSGSAASGGGGVKGRSRRMNVAILFLLRHLVGEKTCEVFSCHLHVCNREYD